MKKKTMVLLLVVSALVIGSSAFAGNATWFVCNKCGVAVQKDFNNWPSMSKCPAGAVHQWTNICAAGNDAYMCSKCRAQVSCKNFNYPNIGKCPAGGGHKWGKL